MKTMKLLALLLLALPAIVRAQTFTYTNGNDVFFYSITNNNTINIINWGAQNLDDSGPVIIPSVMNGLTVTSIGFGAFNSRTTLTGVTIPNTVTSIGNDAFATCYSLTNVTIPDSVTSLGSGVFDGCNNLASVTIPNSLTSIGDSDFYGCALTNVSIPNSVTSIGASAFSCPNLTSITIPNSVTNIGDYAFSGTSLTSVTIPNSVTSIGIAAFEECYSLTNITIPNSVTNIADSTFYECYVLADVYFTGNAPTIGGGYAFKDYTHTTAHYLPGTTGWDEFTANTGVSAVLWLPQLQTIDGNFGVLTNGFGFNISWASGQVLVVEASTNLANPVWSPVTTNTFISDLSYFSDPQWTNYPGRFYRLRSP